MRAGSKLTGGGVRGVGIARMHAGARVCGGELVFADKFNQSLTLSQILDALQRPPYSKSVVHIAAPTNAAAARHEHDGACQQQQCIVPELQRWPASHAPSGSA